MKLHRRPWKVIAMGVIVNAIALAITVLVLPGVEQNTDRPVLGYLALGALFGLLNAFVKPALQFVALPFLLGSMGFVVILVDIIVFALLDELTPNLLSTDGPGWIVLAGVLLGVVGYVLENLLGVAEPIVADDRTEVTA